MGLIYNILISAVHLLFVVMDIFFVMIAAKIIYDHWRPSWLKQIIEVITPIIDHTLNYAKGIASKLTGKIYSEKTLLLLIVIGMAVVRLIVTSLL